MQIPKEDVPGWALRTLHWKQKTQRAAQGFFGCILTLRVQETDPALAHGGSGAVLVPQGWVRIWQRCFMEGSLVVDPCVDVAHGPTCCAHWG